LKIRHVYLANRKITVNNGLSTLFWEDSWLKDKSLCTLHPALYDFCLDKFVSVHLVLSKNAQLQFSRWLSPILFDSWLNIVNEVYSYSFNNTRDKVVWKCNKLGYFSTKSTYDALSSNECGQTFVHIWKAKIPYRIKIFMWLLENNAVLTKDNLLRRNWVGSPSCYFYQNNESIDHLFFMCPVAKVIWGMVGLSIGATNIPNTLSQAKIWFVHWLPGGEQIYTFCMAAICWAI